MTQTTLQWDHINYYSANDGGDNDLDRQQYAIGTKWETTQQIQPCYYIKTPTQFQQMSLANSRVGTVKERIHYYAQIAMELVQSSNAVRSNKKK